MRVRRRIASGELESGRDVSLLRQFIGLSQAEFAQSMGISVHTLRNWEQGRRVPEGPAIALLRIAARHPGVLRENLPARYSGRTAGTDFATARTNARTRAKAE
jgi:putative transcriptional regulator